MSLTFFDDLDAVRGFAGADYETAVVAEDARRSSAGLMSGSATTRPRSKPEGSGLSIGTGRYGGGLSSQRSLCTLTPVIRVVAAWRRPWLWPGQAG